MPSTRRVRILGILVAVLVFTILYLTADARQARDSDFYQKTVHAMDAHNGKDTEAADVGQRLKNAEAAAKKAADAAGEKHKEAVLGVDKEPLELDDEIEKSVAGRKKMNKAEKWEVTPAGGKEAKPSPPALSPEEEELENELNDILKRSPIIIFSKTHCPFSKKAKHILVEKYKIVPPPFVVELDEHRLGSQLQDILEKMTGRHTVPNVLINGKSIGGGDDVEELDTSNTLIDKVKQMGGKRIMEAKLSEA
ncbi:glutaredoxin [Xylona heveae TC161]|uniref:Glutaredoxin n=1 Tax=Xylona heveae (strain CBS 132557 / TC161) TaxID=1328760 RepID=A0A165JJZ6_XYLHT|nr:glutaredoxin [Xylona heveae TC161]KZF26333.1 glutaredoxin [Xylona heveae TC161]